MPLEECSTRKHLSSTLTPSKQHIRAQCTHRIELLTKRKRRKNRKKEEALWIWQSCPDPLEADCIWRFWDRPWKVLDRPSFLDMLLIPCLICYDPRFRVEGLQTRGHTLPPFWYATEGFWIDGSQWRMNVRQQPLLAGGWRGHRDRMDLGPLLRIRFCLFAFRPKIEIFCAWTRYTLHVPSMFSSLEWDSGFEEPGDVRGMRPFWQNSRIHPARAFGSWGNGPENKHGEGITKAQKTFSWGLRFSVKPARPFHIFW